MIRHTGSRSSALALMLVVPIAVTAAAGQDVSSASVDVASVKANRMPLARGVNWPSLRAAGNGVNATAMTPFELFAFAYDVNLAHVIGTPAWATTERYDVLIRAEQSQTNIDGNRALARAVLESEFRVRMHRETRALPRYRLVLARKDGRLGPKIKPSRKIADCASAFSEYYPPALPCRILPGGDGLNGTGVPASEVVRMLGVLAAQFGGVDDATLVDETGLTGYFDLDFAFSARDAFVARQAAPGGAADPAGSVPAFRNAVVDQLGMKIESASVPTEIVVIDGIERPR